MKGTYGRIPRGPQTHIAPNTVVLGCVARSVRDVARYYDCCAGYDPHDPTSLAKEEGWERDLGTQDLSGRTVVVAPSLGTVPLKPGVEASIIRAAEALIADHGMKRVDVDVDFDVPRLGVPWTMGNLASLLVDIGDRWPKCAEELTEELAFAFTLAWNTFDLELAAEAERRRTEANEAMASLFEKADFVICGDEPRPRLPRRARPPVRGAGRQDAAEDGGQQGHEAGLAGPGPVHAPRRRGPSPHQP